MQMIDVSEVFTKGRKGVSIWLHNNQYQVSVRQSDGSFAVGIHENLNVALSIALRDDDLL